MATEPAPPASADGPELVGERVRIFLRGRTWYANFQQGRKQHRPSLKTRSKKEARRRALLIEADLAKGTWKVSRPPSSVGDAIAAYRDFLRAEERSPKTLAKYGKVFDRVAELAKRRR